MPQPFVVIVPHQLGRQAAKDRLARGLDHIRSEFDFGHLGPDHAAWQRAYAMPWRSWIGSFRMFDLVRDMEKP